MQGTRGGRPVRTAGGARPPRAPEAERACSSDIAAARAPAQLFSERARERGFQQITFQRPEGMRYSGKLKAIIEALRETGIRFVSHAGAASRVGQPRAPPLPPPAAVQYVRRANTNNTGRYRLHVPEPPHWLRARGRASAERPGA